LLHKALDAINNIVNYTNTKNDNNRKTIQWYNVVAIR